MKVYLDFESIQLSTAQEVNLLKQAGAAIVVLCDRTRPGWGQGEAEARRWLTHHGYLVDMVEQIPPNNPFAFHLWFSARVARLPQSPLTFVISPSPLVRNASVALCPRATAFHSVAEAVAALPSELRRELGLLDPNLN